MIRSTLAMAVLAAVSVSAHAELFNQNVTSNVIMGTGITNGGFTVGTDGGFELGLRARDRYSLVGDAATNVTGINANGTYNQNAGAPNAYLERARWNFDWSIYAAPGTGGLTGRTYRLGLDFDPGVGTNYYTFDPINVAYADHSFGNSGTAQSAGVEAALGDATQYTALRAENSLVQQSWNYGFFSSTDRPFNPAADGTYSIFLEVLSGTEVLAHTDIDVIVGRGAQVPEPASIALLGLGLVGLVGLRRRKHS